MRRLTISGVLAAVALALAVLVAAFGLYSFPLTGVPIGTDSAVFSYVGEVVAEGGMPYVDVFDHKGPLVYLVNALASLGPSTWLLWAIEVGTLAATAFLFYALGRAAGAPRGIAAIVAAAVAFLVVSRAEGGNMTEQYCLPFMAAVMLASVRAMREGSLSHGFAAAMGACVAAVLLLRFTALVGLVAFCAWALAIVWRRAGAESAFALVGWFALGAIAVSAPVLAWLAVGGALGAFAQQYFAFNLLYAGATSGADRLDALAFFAADPALLFALALAAAAVQLGRRGAPAWAIRAGAAVAALALVVVPSAYETYERAAWHKSFAAERAQVTAAVANAADGREALAVGNECWVYLDSAARAPVPYAYRSTEMAERYSAWLAGLLADDERAPAAIVVARYVPVAELEATGLYGRYQPITETAGFTVYARR